MRNFFASLYGRISAIFLLLLLTLGLIQLVLGVQSARNFSLESDQSLNRDLASQLARTFQPALENGLDEAAMAGHIHDLMVFNPRVEAYLLDAGGRILAHAPGDKPLARRSVDMAPVRSFVSSGGRVPLPLYGDDPRSTEKRKPFSAAQVRIGPQTGYLYLILGGEQYDSIAAMVEESYIIRNSLVLLAGSMFLIGVVGLIVFFQLTKRVRAMVSAVRGFEAGDYARRVAVTQSDEIGQLGRAFNEMAEKVEATLEALRQSDTLRRELVANVSHDLRSPLTSLQGYLETLLMKEETFTPGERRRFLKVIHGNALRLNRLVDELFELTRLEAHQVQPRLEPFALAELVQDVVVKFQPRAQQRQVRLTAHHPAKLSFVEGDIGMIERVLDNLIDNGLRFTAPGGQVEVRLEEGPETVAVRVVDTGEGIPPEDVPYVFDRFYRADKSRSRHPEGAGGEDASAVSVESVGSAGSVGSGIGLAIAKRIMEAHGSEIEIESTSSAGTVFVFRVPALHPAAGN